MVTNTSAPPILPATTPVWELVVSVKTREQKSEFHYLLIGVESIGLIYLNTYVYISLFNDWSYIKYFDTNIFKETITDSTCCFYPKIHCFSIIYILLDEVMLNRTLRAMFIYNILWYIIARFYCYMLIFLYGP